MYGYYRALAAGARRLRRQVARLPSPARGGFPGRSRTALDARRKRAPPPQAGARRDPQDRGMACQNRYAVPDSYMPYGSRTHHAVGLPFPPSCPVICGHVRLKPYIRRRSTGVWGCLHPQHCRIIHGGWIAAPESFGSGIGSPSASTAPLLQRCPVIAVHSTTVRL